MEKGFRIPALLKETQALQDRIAARLAGLKIPGGQAGWQEDDL